MDNLHSIRQNILTPSLIGLDLQVSDGEQAWYLIMSDDPPRVVEDICATLEASDVSYMLVEASDPKSLLSKTEAKACIPLGTEKWDIQAYEKLDLLRAPIRVVWPIIFWVTSRSAVAKLVHHAPNFAAFFQPSVGILSDETMSDLDIQTHLKALREQYAQSDEEILSLAKSGNLPQDADHHLWLVLLGRGDLIPSIHGFKQ